MQEDIGPYEGKVRASGIPIHVLPMKNKVGWFLHFYRFLRENGPFDIVHSHHDPIISGPALATARLANVPVRIAHNHAARLMGEDYRAFRLRFRETVGRAFVEFGATRRIGISSQAMWHLIGSGWEHRDDCTVLLYGFDYGMFEDANSRANVLRSRYGLPKDAPIIGHVGRFDSVKNHPFIIEIFWKFLKTHPNARLILIGRGPLEDTVKSDIADRKIQDNIIIIEGTDDVPAHMALFDAFLFPSFSEGLGIVVLEAQAAGTPTLMTDILPPEVVVVPEAVSTLPLAAGAEAWAEALAKIVVKKELQEGEWLRRVEESSFGIRRCVSDLNRIYEEEIRSRIRNTS